MSSTLINEISELKAVMFQCIGRLEHLEKKLTGKSDLMESKKTRNSLTLSTEKCEKCNKKLKIPLKMDCSCVIHRRCVDLENGCCPICKTEIKSEILESIKAQKERMRQVRNKRSESVAVVESIVEPVTESSEVFVESEAVPESGEESDSGSSLSDVDRDLEELAAYLEN
jgi:hypothetical protein